MERPEEPFAIAVRDIDEYLSDARDFVGGPKLQGSVSSSKTWTQLSRRVHQVMHLFTPGGGRKEHAGTEEPSQGTPNKHYYEARTTTGQTEDSRRL